MGKLKKFLKKVRQVTLKDLESGHKEHHLFRHTVEELGEYAQAITVEEGVKKKDLKENSKVESVDFLICGLSLFFCTGGTVDELTEIGNNKLSKWAKRVQKKMQKARKKQFKVKK